MEKNEHVIPADVIPAESSVCSACSILYSVQETLVMFSSDTQGTLVIFRKRYKELYSYCDERTEQEQELTGAHP